MRRVAIFAVFAVFVVTGFAADEKEEDDAWRAARRLSHPVARRHALLKFVEEFPNSKRVPDALWKAITDVGVVEPEDKKLCMDTLRRLVRDHPHYLNPFRTRLGKFLEELDGWSFSTLPGYLGAFADRTVGIHRKKGPEKGTFRFFRCPHEKVRKQLHQRAVDVTEAEEPAAEDYVEVETIHVDYRAKDASIAMPGEPGLYIVEEETGGFRHRWRVRIAPFAILAQVVSGQLEVYTAEPTSGEPHPGVAVTVRSEDETHKGRTGPDGRVRFTCQLPAIVIGEFGDFVDGLALPWPAPSAGKIAYVTTDRPVYRPNHEVHYKVVRRDAVGGRLQLPPEKPVRVEMRGPEGRLLASQVRTWSATGSITGSFVLGDEPPLGRYGLLVNVKSPWYQEDEYDWVLDEGDETKWRTTFQVAAYRKPEVRISVERGPRTKEGMIPVTLTAEHASGGAIAQAEVSWAADAIYSWREDTDITGLHDDPRWWYFKPRSYSWDRDEEAVGDGEGTTDAEGKLRFEIQPYRWATEYRISAYVTDAAGLEHEARAVVADEPDDGRFELRVARHWCRPGEKLEVMAVLVTPGGRPIEGRPVKLEMETDGDEGEDEATTVRFDGKTDAKGQVIFVIDVPDTAALWFALYPPDDSEKDEPVAEAMVRVAGGELPDDEITVFADKNAYEPGETAQLVLRTAAVPLWAILTVEAGRFRDARTIHLKSREEELELPIRTGDSPELKLRIQGYRDSEPIAGGITLPVYPRTSILDLNTTTDREEYGPGDPVTVTVTAVDSAGRPVVAEVELAVVDESIFQMAPDLTEDIRRFFLRKQFRRYEVYGTFHYEDPADYGGYGFFSEEEAMPLFGKAEEGEAMEGGAFVEADVRRRFLDTWHYDARVTTGEDGRAEVKLEAPDTLSKWRIVARATAGTDRFGTCASETTTTKKVVVRLITPRFLVKGDEGEVALLVRNGLEEAAQFDIALSGAGLWLDTATSSVSIPAGGEILIDRKVKATSLGMATLTAQALGKIESDAMEVKIPVRALGARMRAAAAGVVQGTWSHEFVVPEGVDLQSVKIEVTAGTPADAIGQALPTLAGFPYGCVEQTMSRFLPSVVAGGAMKRLGIENEELASELPAMVSKGLMRLYRFQHEDGGWGWWETDATDAEMTAYVVFGLATAKRAGYEIDGPTLKRGLEALAKMPATAFAVYARQLAGEEGTEKVQVAVRNDLDRAWLILSGRKDVVERLEVDLSGAQEMAVGLRALHAMDPADNRIPGLLQQLLLMRRGAAWETTIDSAHAVYALCDIVGTNTQVDFTIRKPAPIRHGKNVVSVTKDGEGVLFASASMTWFQEDAKPDEDGMSLKRTFETVIETEYGVDYLPIESGSAIRVGEEIRITLQVEGDRMARYVLLESPIAAGTEPWLEHDDYWDPWESWYQRRELRDDRVAVAADSVNGYEEFSFRLKATHPGTWQIGPATVYPMYDPNHRGLSKPFVLKVTR